MSPWVKSRYPEAWPMIRDGIRVRSGGRCECEGECGLHAGRRCVERHGEPAAFARGKIVLTVAHLDHDPEHNAPENLRHLCQRCHLRYDLEHHQHNARRTREARRVNTTRMSSSTCKEER